MRLLRAGKCGILLKKNTESIMGKTIEIISIKEGILLKPVDDAIAAAKGVLKKHSFSTKKYLLQKKEDKKQHYLNKRCAP